MHLPPAFLAFCWRAFRLLVSPLIENFGQSSFEIQEIRHVRAEFSKHIQFSGSGPPKGSTRVFWLTFLLVTAFNILLSLQMECQQDAFLHVT
jgi:hypothetical protein